MSKYLIKWKATLMKDSIVDCEDVDKAKEIALKDKNKLLKDTKPYMKWEIDKVMGG